MKHEVETDEVAEGDTEVSGEFAQIRSQSRCACGFAEQINFAVPEKLQMQPVFDRLERKKEVVSNLSVCLVLCVSDTL